MTQDKNKMDIDATKLRYILKYLKSRFTRIKRKLFYYVSIEYRFVSYISKKETFKKLTNISRHSIRNISNILIVC